MGLQIIEYTRRFLKSRLMADGKTSLWDTVDELPHGDGWWEYRNKAYDPEKLPKVSKGQYAYSRDPPDWESLFHCTKMEALYSIASSWNERDGGIVSSGDKDKGQRYNQDKKGVYFHERKDLQKGLEAYARWSPVFGDGTYLRVYFETMCDRYHRVPYRHTDQKIQKPNSIADAP